ncbi:MAG: peptide chain release factor N(5)-glutamine methyltransferase [Actinobacteria bacterium]|nr:peptide chain release factor N(5)-glutamine methyltransferase [Actinomycetota bacterium]
MTTAATALTRATDRLSRAGCESAHVDAEILLAHVLETTRSALRADTRRELDDAASDELDRLLARRERREPLAYVLGEWGFRRLTLNVDARVLVPRPETEIVVERCLARIAGVTRPRVLDVGTGSGAIALAIADEAPGTRVTAMDASQDALDVARENSSRTGLTVEVVHGDLFDGLPDGPWDLVVSNPPYVRPHEIDALEPEVRDWEPRAALVGEGATEAVARAAVSVLRSGGALVLETADGDNGRVADLLHRLGYVELETTSDLAGRDRAVEGVTT